MSDETQAELEAQEQGGLVIQETAPVPIAAILPDPGQPRRLLPDDLAQGLVAGDLTAFEAMGLWLERAEQDPTWQHAIVQLQRLAESIAQHGLISPISVRPPRPGEVLPANVKYLIVTGERRFWSHVYLTNQNRAIRAGESVTAPDQIKVTFVPLGVSIRAHQLIENLLREDINALERARGMWALRYELSGWPDQLPPLSQPGDMDEVNPGMAYTIDPDSLSESPDDHPQTRLVPWAQVEQALGISKRYRIFITSVLQLAPKAQVLVHRYNLAERTLRPIVQKLRNKPELQIQAIKQLAAWKSEEDELSGPDNAIVKAVSQLVNDLLAVEKDVNPAPFAEPRRSVSSAPVIRFRSKVRQPLEFLHRLKDQDRNQLTDALTMEEFADIRADLSQLRHYIDQILGAAEDDENLSRSAGSRE